MMENNQLDINELKIKISLLENDIREKNTILESKMSADRQLFNRENEILLENVFSLRSELYGRQKALSQEIDRIKEKLYLYEIDTYNKRKSDRLKFIAKLQQWQPVITFATLLALLLLFIFRH